MHISTSCIDCIKKITRLITHACKFLFSVCHLLRSMWTLLIKLEKLKIHHGLSINEILLGSIQHNGTCVQPTGKKRRSILSLCLSPSSCLLCHSQQMDCQCRRRGLTRERLIGAVSACRQVWRAPLNQYNARANATAILCNPNQI